MKIAVLAGGVGGSKLLLGLYRVMDPAGLTIIVNTGDDIVMHGLHVSPDPDIITYTLAGIVNEETGWGTVGETFRIADGLAGYGRPIWFKLGDRDLATHIAHMLPMSDDPVPTLLDTNEGRLHLQEYLVRRRCEPVLKAIAFEGADRARPAPGVIDAIENADRIIISPSNPLISIGPILAVPGIRESLRKRREDVVAICPLVGGKSLKGPSDKMMAELGHEVSAAGVASLYRDICGTFVIDDADHASRAAIEALDMAPIVLPTVMKTVEDKERLARAVLALFARP